MKELLGLCFSLLLFTVASGERSSYPRERTVCGRAKCSGLGRKFAYKDPNEYFYSYTINGTSLVEGGPAEESGLHIHAAVALKFISPCEGFLIVEDARVLQSHKRKIGSKHEFLHPKGGDGMEETLTKFPLRFSYADGVFEEICPQDEEPVWSANLKRGLLSHLQNSMKRLDLDHDGEEEDVQGRCKVEYVLGTATSSSLGISKRKNLDSCTNSNFGILSALRGVPYAFGSVKRSMPAMASTSECEQTVDKNLISGVKCIEIHRLKTISRGVSGAYTRIESSLFLTGIYDPTVDPDDVGEENELQPSISRHEIPKFANLQRKPVEKRSNLRFEHAFSVPKGYTDYSTAKAALANYCIAIKSDVSQKAGQLFESLIETLRGVETGELMSRLARDAPDVCQGRRDPFDEVIGWVETGPAIHLMKERILETKKEIAESWIKSLAFFRKPDLSVLTAGINLLRNRTRENYPDVLLSFSSLAYTFCSSPGSNCLNLVTQDPKSPISTLSRLYENYLNQICKNDHEMKRNDREIEQILKYMKGIGNFGLRTEGILKGLESCAIGSNNIEIQIAAIDGHRRMECSGGNPEWISSIFEDPEHDSELRIAAFLALMKCPNLSTVLRLKRILSLEQVNQVGSFVTSYLKNVQETGLPSRAELQSLFSDEKLGEKFSPDFRRYSRNFEISSFYEELNLGGGLETNLIFSPSSYIPRVGSFNVTLDLFGESVNVFEATVRVQNYEKVIERLIQPTRSSSPLSKEKRLVPSKRRLKALSMDFDAQRKYHSDPIASLSVRTLGHEILFARRVGLAGQGQFLKSLSPFRDIFGEKDKNFERSTVLVDSSYIIPTGIGLPLNLTALATSIFKFETESSFENLGNEVKLKGKFAPSGQLSISGSLVLGLGPIQSGIKVKAYVRSSTALEGYLHIKANNLFEIDFGLPKSELELLEYRSDVYFVDGSEFVAVGDVPTMSRICLGGGMEQTTGFRLCRASHFTLGPKESPYYPLNGPANFLLTLGKTDGGATRAKFYLESIISKELVKMGIAYETSGAKGPIAKLSALFDLKVPERNFNLRLNMPGMGLSSIGKLAIDSSDGLLELRILNNEVPFLHAFAGFNESWSDSETRVVYPRAGLAYKGKQLFDSKGDINVEKSNSKFSGRSEVNWKGQRTTLVLVGFQSPQELQVSADLEYKTEEHKTEAVKLKVRIGKGIDTESSLQFTQFPHQDLGFVVKFKDEDDGLNGTSIFRMGSIGKPSFLVSLAGFYRGNFEGTEGGGEIRLVQRGADWRLQGTIISQGKSLDSAINLQYAPGKEVKSSLSMKRAPGHLTFLQLSWNVSVGGEVLPLNVFLLHEESQPRVFKGKLFTEWFGRKSMKVNFNHSDYSKRTRMKIDSGIELQFDNYEPLKLTTGFFNDDKDSKIRVGVEFRKNKNGLEVFHSRDIRWRRQAFAWTVTSGGKDYAVKGNLNFDGGFDSSFWTHFGGLAPDTYIHMRGRKDSKLTDGVFEMKWDVGRGGETHFVAEGSASGSGGKLVVSYPKTRLEVLASQRDEGTGLLTGKLICGMEEIFNVNATMKSLSKEVKEILLFATTGFEDFRNVRISTRFEGGRRRLLHLHGHWGLDGKVEGIFNLEGNSKLPFKGSARGNYTWGGRAVHISMLHNHESSWRLNTDFDIQVEICFPLSLPTIWVDQVGTEKAITFTSQLHLPKTLKEIVGSRAEMHLKTPFPGLTNADFQAVVGHGEDGDLMANLGFYVEMTQYAIRITGTPRFGSNGAVGFEMNTSSKYEKVFGSFNYQIGPNSRLVAQVGSPSGIVGFDSGFDYASLQEFQAHMTLSSPWEPLRTFHLLAKRDEGQAQIRGELNEEASECKADWSFESFSAFSFGVEGSSPLANYELFGARGSQALEFNEDEGSGEYAGELTLWVNEDKAGYKFKVGDAEVLLPDEETLVKVSNLEVELLPVFYPLIRATGSLTQDHSKFNLGGSVLLREGAINVSMDLVLLGLFRFDENITITTPYEGLYELQLHLAPAIVPEAGIYNLAIDSKWRSGTEWKQGGFVVRFGDQTSLVDYMEEEGAGEIPMSQVIHWYSPLKTAREVRVEYEGPVGQIPNLSLVFSGEGGEMKTTVKNEELVKELSAQISFPNISHPLHLKFSSNLDLTNPEKTLHIQGNSGPSDEVLMEAKWQLESREFRTASFDFATPFEGWEKTSLKGETAVNSNEGKTSLDIELDSYTHGKFSWESVYGPRHVSMSVTSPFENYEAMEFACDVGDVGIGKFLTVGKGTKGDDFFNFDFETSLKDGWPNHVNGTVETSLPKYHEGTFEATVEVFPFRANTSARIQFEDSQMRGMASLGFNDQQFTDVQLKVETPFPGFESLEVEAKVSEGKSLELNGKSSWEPLGVFSASGDVEIGSLWEVLEVKVNSEIPSGNLSVLTSWNFDSWENNEFDFRGKSVCWEGTVNFVEFHGVVEVGDRRGGGELDLRTSSSSLTRFGGAAWFATDEDSMRINVSSFHPPAAILISSTTKEDNFNATIGVNAPPHNLNAFIDWKLGSEEMNGNAGINLGQEFLNGSFSSTFSSDIVMVDVKAKTTRTSLNASGEFDQNFYGNHLAKVSVKGSEESTLDFSSSIQSLFDFSTSLNLTSGGGIGGSFEALSRLSGSNYEALFGIDWAKRRSSVKLNLDYVNSTEFVKFDSDVSVEWPYPNPHSASFTAAYKGIRMDREIRFEGEIDGRSLVGTSYKFEATSSAGIEREETKILLENPFYPFGIKRIYEYEYSGGFEGLNLPTTITHGGELFDLRNPEIDKLSGLFRVDTNFNGREMTIRGSHPGRTLLFSTNYSFTHHRFVHNSAFSWDSESSVGYGLTLINKTNDLKVEGGIEKLSDGGMNAECLLDYSGQPDRILVVRLNGPNLDLFPNLRTDVEISHRATKVGVLASHRYANHEVSIITLIDSGHYLKPPQKSKILFELLTGSRHSLQMMAQIPQEQSDLTVSFHNDGAEWIIRANSSLNDTDGLFTPSAVFTFKSSQFKAEFRDGNELSPSAVFAQGGVLDGRNVRFDIWGSKDGFEHSDVSFFLRLNHSRLLSSKLKWRPELLENLEEEVLRLIAESAESLRGQGEKLLRGVGDSAYSATLAVWEDANEVLSPFIEEIKTSANFTNDTEALYAYIAHLKENNEFYLNNFTNFLDLMAEEVSFKFSDIFLRLRIQLRHILGESSLVFEKCLLWTLEKVRVFYQSFDSWWRESGEWPTLPAFSFLDFQEKIGLHLYKVIEGVLKLGEEMVAALSTLTSSATTTLNKMMEEAKPAILATLNNIETLLYSAIIKISDFFYETRDEVVRSKYYQNLARLASDVDQLYVDLSQNGPERNIRKYYVSTRDLIYKKLRAFFSFLRNEVSALSWDDSGKWTEVVEEFLHRLSDDVSALISRFQWLVEYFNVDEAIQDLLVTAYVKGGDLLYQKISDATGRLEESKTKFIFDPKRGIVELEQKLPFPWTSFNETPRIAEIDELAQLYRISNMLKKSGGPSSLDRWMEIGTRNLLPPFDGHGIILDLNRFFTLDGSMQSGGNSSCALLLLADFVDSNFSLTALTRTKEDGGQEKGILFAAFSSALLLDFNDNAVKDGKDSILSLPTSTPHLEAYGGPQEIVINMRDNSITLTCNIPHAFCQIMLSGWYSGKVGGLLGTLDGETFNDLRLPNGTLPRDISGLLSSWDVSEDGNCIIQSETTPKRQLSAGCEKILKSELSPLQPCFSTVNTSLYEDVCEVNGVCKAALTYLTRCQSEGILVQVPSACTKCSLNGEEMIDGEVKLLEKNSSSTDVVLIVEARECNRNLRSKKKLDGFIKLFEQELALGSFKPPRYAVVVFGGEGIFAHPHPIVIKGRVFSTDPRNHLGAVPQGSGGSIGDVFAAISLALSLEFREGASKTLILFPCNSCIRKTSSIEFSRMAYGLQEHGAKLHVLTNDEFIFENINIGKKFFGIDSQFAYIKSDSDKNGLKGDLKIKRLAKLPNERDVCNHLALRTNGTVFAGRKLQNKKDFFARVLSRRIVKSAEPPPCQNCYCSGTKAGVGKVQCFLCGYTPDLLTDSENELNENETRDVDRTLYRSNNNSDEDDEESF